MKGKKEFPFLLALLLTSSAPAQIVDSQIPTALAKNELSNVAVDKVVGSERDKNDLPKPVADALCAYTQTDTACAGVPSNPNSSDPRSNTTLAQMPRRYPGPMAGPEMGRAAYPGMWMSRPSPAHVLIGAIIGFGIGAALAAKASPNARGVLIFGTLGAGVGAGMGADMPSFPSRHYDRRRWPDYDEDASRSKPAPSKPESAGRTPAGPDPDRSVSMATETARSEDPVSIASRTP